MSAQNDFPQKNSAILFPHIHDNSQKRYNRENNNLLLFLEPQQITPRIYHLSIFLRCLSADNIKIIMNLLTELESCLKRYLNRK